MTLRPAKPSDHDAIWEMFRAVIVPGDAFMFDPQMPRADALAWWFAAGNRSYVVENDGQVVGAYIFKANQPGLGAHVANAAFIVAPAARGQGIGRLMGEHCLVEARKAGFRAMQFNFVISTNETAVRLWQKLGFKIVGTLPAAFRHSQLGFVDVYVMFRTLHDGV